MSLHGHVGVRAIILDNDCDSFSLDTREGVSKNGGEIFFAISFRWKSLIVGWSLPLKFTVFLDEEHEEMIQSKLHECDNFPMKFCQGSRPWKRQEES